MSNGDASQGDKNERWHVIQATKDFPAYICTDPERRHETEVCVLYGKRGNEYAYRIADAVNGLRSETATASPLSAIAEAVRLCEAEVQRHQEAARAFRRHPQKPTAARDADQRASGARDCLCFIQDLQARALSAPVTETGATDEETPGERRLRHRLEKIDAALDELGAPTSGDWDGLDVGLSQVGRIRALVGGGGRGKKALAWAVETFGEVAKDRDERAMRFIEEAVELAFTLGLPAETLEKIANRVYSRPKGERWQEFGQAQLTLELLGEAYDIKPQLRAQIEFERIQAIPKEEWERRHKAKIELGIAK